MIIDAQSFIPRRIAVWNTAFLGDAVLTLPLIQSLALRYPEASIDFYVRKGLAPLFSVHPAVSAVFSHDKRGSEKGLPGMFRLGKAVAARKYDLWISAHSSSRSSFITRMSGAPVRIGYTSSAFNKLCYTHTINRRFDELEEVERLLQLLIPLGEGPVSDWPEIHLPLEVLHEAEQSFHNMGAGPVLGIHPGSVWPTKRWLPEYFAEAGALAAVNGAQVAIFAGPDEMDTAREVLEGVYQRIPSSVHPHIHDFSGRLSLPLLAAHIGRLNCYLTNDSGPMHLAWAQHVPVAAVFGPTVRDLGFFPRGEASRVFESDETCRPCGLHGHKSCPKGHHNCMVSVSPHEVWSGVRNALNL